MRDKREEDPDMGRDKRAALSLHLQKMFKDADAR